MKLLSQDYNPASDTICVVLIFYMSGGTYSLKSILGDWFFKYLFMAILFTFTVFVSNLLIGSRWRNIYLYCYVVTFLKTFKFEFINCKQSKNNTSMCLIFLFSLLYTLFMCPTVSNLYSKNYNNICLFDILLTQLCAILHTMEIFKHATVLFTRNFTQGWVNSYWLLALFCPFTVEHI